METFDASSTCKFITFLKTSAARIVIMYTPALIQDLVLEAYSGGGFP